MDNDDEGWEEERTVDEVVHCVLILLIEWNKEGVDWRRWWLDSIFEFE